MAATAATAVLAAALVTLLLVEQTCCAVDEDVATFTATESSLRSKLMGGYYRGASPAHNDTDVIELRFYAHIGKLLELNMKNETMKLFLFCSMRWTDERLTWNPDDYGGIKEINLYTEYVWIPPLFLHDSIPDASLTGALHEGGYVLVNSEGQMERYAGMTVMTRCQMDSYNFPHEQIQCMLGLSSHYGSQVAVKAHKWVGFIDRSNDWQILNATVENHNYTYEPRTYYYVVYTLTLARHATFYVHLYVVPPALISMLIPFLFLLHATGPHRVILGTGILLCMCLIIGKFDWMLAGDGGMPKVGQFYIGVLAMSAVAFMLTVFVAAVAARHKGSNKPPALVNLVIGDMLGKVLFVAYEKHDDTMPLSDPADSTTANGTAPVNISELPALEWLHLARVLDRAFFVIFSVVDVILMFSLLL